MTVDEFELWLEDNQFSLVCLRAQHRELAINFFKARLSTVETEEDIAFLTLKYSDYLV